MGRPRRMSLRSSRESAGRAGAGRRAGRRQRAQGSSIWGRRRRRGRGAASASSRLGAAKRRDVGVTGAASEVQPAPPPPAAASGGCHGPRVGGDGVPRSLSAVGSGPVPRGRPDSGMIPGLLRPTRQALPTPAPSPLPFSKELRAAFLVFILFLKPSRGVPFPQTCMQRAPRHAVPVGDAGRGGGCGVRGPRRGFQDGQRVLPSLCLGPQGQGGPVCGTAATSPPRPPGRSAGPVPGALGRGRRRSPSCPPRPRLLCARPAVCSASRTSQEHSEARPVHGAPGAAGFSGLCGGPVGEGDEREAPQWPFRVAGFPPLSSPPSLRLLPSVSQPALPQEAGCRGARCRGSGSPG